MNLLEKITQHKQEQHTQYSRTIFLDGILNASEIHAKEIEYNNLAMKLKKNSILANGILNTLTEVVNVATKISRTNQVKAESDYFIIMGNEFKEELSCLLSTTIDGRKILQDTIDVDLGLNSETIKIGINLSEDDNYHVVNNAANTMATGNPYPDQNKLDSAVSGLSTSLAILGSQTSLLENRCKTVQNVSKTYIDSIDMKEMYNTNIVNFLT